MCHMDAEPTSKSASKMATYSYGSCGARPCTKQSEQRVGQDHAKARPASPLQLVWMSMALSQVHIWYIGGVAGRRTSYLTDVSHPVEHIASLCRASSKKGSVRAQTALQPRHDPH